MHQVRAAVSAIVVAAIALTDQRGNHFTLDSLRGHPVVLTFIAAHCTDACPLIEAQIADAAAHEQSVRGRTRFVTMSIDPRHDSDADMQRIARTFNANASYWRVARAPTAATRDLERTFGVVTAPGRNGFETMHTTLLYVLDRNGRYVESILPSNHLTSQVAHVEEL